MLKSIKLFFDNLSPPAVQTEQEKQHAIHLAVAVLLVEMSRMDGQVDESEFTRIQQVLEQQFKLNNQEKKELTELANQQLDNSTDYYQFTSVINQHFNQKQKIRMIEDLWHTAFADGEVDPHEEHFLRKIHSLLHVSHSHFMRTKDIAKPRS